MFSTFTKLEDLIDNNYDDCIVHTSNYKRCLRYVNSTFILSETSKIDDFIRDESNLNLSPELTILKFPLEFRSAIHISYHFSLYCVENKNYWLKNGKKYCITARGEFKVADELLTQFTIHDLKNTWNVRPVFNQKGAG